MKNKGFTLIELLVVIAMSNFFTAKRAAARNTCVVNLKQIQIVVNTWALDTGAASDATVTIEDLVPNYIKAWPKEGTLDYPLPASIGAKPVCPNASVTLDHTI